MFDFEYLTVYQKARLFNKDAHFLIESTPRIRTNLKDQLSRASSSIALNLAEGTGKFTPKDKARFYYQSRGSCYECVALFDMILDMSLISKDQYETLYRQLEEIAKMLTGLIQSAVRKAG